MNAKKVSRRAAILVPELKLAINARARFVYTQLIMRVHVPYLKSASQAILQVCEAFMNLGSFGGSMVCFKANTGKTKAEIARMCIGERI